MAQESSRTSTKVDASRRSDWLATRQQILEVARASFSERGYQATTVKDVATAAGVAEVTLFRHFRTKAVLFEEAAIEPLNAFLTEWIGVWTDALPGERDITAEGQRFFVTLMDLLVREKKLVATFLSALAVDHSEVAISPEARSFMANLLDQLETVFAREGNVRGYIGDPHVTPRLIMAMALGMVTHGDWLFGPGRTPSQDVLVAEMAKLTVFGLGWTGPRA